jgi:hypothetical protein
MSQDSIASSLSRPISAPASVAVGTVRTLLLEHLGNKRHFSNIDSALKASSGRDGIASQVPPVQVARHLAAHKHTKISQHREMNISGNEAAQITMQISLF